MIDIKVIKNLYLSPDRFKNYLDNYKEFEGSLEEFFKLDKILFQDKIWVAFRILTKEQVRKSLGFIAETVLYLYESKYPNDLRPRKAVELAKTGGWDLNIANDAIDAAVDADTYYYNSYTLRSSDVLAAYVAYAAAGASAICFSQYVDDAYTAVLLATSASHSVSSSPANSEKQITHVLNIIVKVSKGEL